MSVQKRKPRLFRTPESGPPDNGEYVVGDLVIDADGVYWVCQEGGWPGTFEELGSMARLEHLVFPFAHNTEGVIVPASGPAGLWLTDLSVGDVLVLGRGGAAPLISYVSTTEAWDYDPVFGQEPELRLTTDSGRGPVGVQDPSWSARWNLLLDETIRLPELSDPNPGAGWESSGSVLTCTVATGLYGYVSSWSNLDPLSTQGESELHLLILRK